MCVFFPMDCLFQDLSRDFNLVSFGEHSIPPEIDLVNEQGRRWTLLLAKNKSSNVFYIRRGWLNFCFVNELSEGDSCRFKMIENGERPVLRLCPQEPNEKSLLDEVSKGREKMTPSPFLELKFTSNRLTTGQLVSSRTYLFYFKNIFNERLLIGSCFSIFHHVSLGRMGSTSLGR